MNSFRIRQHWERDEIGEYWWLPKCYVQIVEGKYASSSLHWYPVAFWMWLKYLWRRVLKKLRKDGDGS